MPRNSADIGRDGHPVIIEDHNQRLVALPRVVQALIGKSARHCAVSHQGDHMIILLLQGPRPRHAEGG